MIECHSEATQQSYAELFWEYLNLTQKYADRINKVHLCLAPIGTNMLLLASELAINVKFGRATQIVAGAYDFDRSYIKRLNRRYGTRHKVLPWVLQRYSNHHHHPAPWTIWFKDLGDNDFQCDDLEMRRDQLEAEMAELRPRIANAHILELGMCTAYVGRFNDKSLAFVGRSLSVPPNGCVGVHIRRGDACDDDLAIKDSGRQHFHIDRYVEEMRRHLDRGRSDFLVLTESESEIDRLAEKLGDRCDIHSQEVDRSRFPSIQTSEHDPRNYIECRCLDDEALAQFAMETALIDLHNAGRCEAFIGSFESAFASVAFLRAVGERRKIIDHTDLSGVGASAKLFHPNLSEARGQSLFVIKERDVGFFSLFLQIVNSLMLIERRRKDLIPFVSLTQMQSYFDGSESWSEVFEPLVDLNRSAIAHLLRKVDASFARRLPEMRIWDRYGLIVKMRKNLYWSGSYYPVIVVRDFSPQIAVWFIVHIRKLFFKLFARFKADQRPVDRPKLVPREGIHISHRALPTEEERDRASRLIGKYISLKPDLREKVNQLFENARGRYILGIQFRGTDARTDGRRSIPKYETFLTAVTKHVASLDDKHRQSLQIFVASDERPFVDFIKQRYKDVLHFDIARHDSSYAEQEGLGPSGWSMPKFVTSNRRSALEGAVLDYAGLCECDFIIHNFGSITNAVLLTRPKIGNQLIGEKYL